MFQNIISQSSFHFMSPDNKTGMGKTTKISLAKRHDQNIY